MDDIARRRELLDVAVRSLHALVDELVETYDLDEFEWHDILSFLAEVGARDQFELLADMTHTSIRLDALWHGSDAGGTRPNPEGPFFRADVPLTDSGVTICRDDEPGVSLTVHGTVTDATTRAGIGGAEVWVWQTGESRLYENEDPDQPEFNLRGRLRTNADGTYQFRTVSPISYEIPGGPVYDLMSALGRNTWRAAHVHFRVVHPTYHRLTTALYLADDPYLDDDAIGAVHAPLVVSPGPGDAYGTTQACRFDLALVAVTPDA